MKVAEEGKKRLCWVRAKSWLVTSTSLHVGSRLTTRSRPLAGLCIARQRQHQRRRNHHLSFSLSLSTTTNAWLPTLPSSAISLSASYLSEAASGEVSPSTGKLLRQGNASWGA